MEKLTWIAADELLNEQCEYQNVKSLDIEISQSPDAQVIDNTFSITIDDAEWASHPVPVGGYIYAPGTEYGGQITLITHRTDEHTITLQGATWRGMLFQRIVEPPSGQAYYEFEGDALALVRALVDGKFGGLFSVASGSSGTDVSVAYRYEKIAPALHATLRNAGLRLTIAFSNVTAKVNVSVDAADDLSNVIEISQDYGVNFTSTEGNVQAANHCLALGGGEMEDRVIVNVYRVGTNYYTQRPASITEQKLRSILLNYGNAESETDLIKTAVQKLEEAAPANKITLNQVEIDEEVDIGDIISIRDRFTGLRTNAEVMGKIVKSANGVDSIYMTVDTVGETLKNVMIWNELKSMTWSQVKTNSWSKYGG